MKHLGKCLLLAGVCLLCSYGSSAAQIPTTSSSQSSSGFFRLPNMGSSARASSQRLQRSDVIQARRSRNTTQNMFQRMGNFIWTFGGLRQVPNSPVTLPSTRRPF